MGLSRFNAEGYSDPTPYQAAANIDRENHRYRPLVYVCSAFSGDVEGNTEKARQYARFAVDSGAIPIVPHLMFPQFMDEASERDLALFMGMVLMRKCEEVWVFGTQTAGMKAEVAKAKRKQMKVRYFTDRMEEQS